MHQQICFLSNWFDWRVLTRTRKKKKKECRMHAKRETPLKINWGRQSPVLTLSTGVGVGGWGRWGGGSGRKQPRETIPPRGHGLWDRKMFQVWPLKVGQYIRQADKNLLSQFTGGRERRASNLTPEGSKHVSVCCLMFHFPTHIRAWNHVNVRFVAKPAHPL